VGEIREVEKASHHTMKQSNREMILKTLRTFPSISRADLAKITKLSKPTVSAIVLELITEGFVTEIGAGISTGGRKPILLQYNATFQFVVGALIEGESLSLVLANLDGKEIEHLSMDLQLPMSVKEIFSLLASGIEEFISHHCEGREQILGIILGVPGISKNQSSGFLHSPGIISESDDEIESTIHKLGIPIVIENDVNLMTIGEYVKKKDRQLDSLLFIFASRGVGCGFIMNQQLQRGHSQAAGEIGSMLIGDPRNLQSTMGVFESNYGALGVSKALQLSSPAKAIETMVKNADKDSEIKVIYEDYQCHWEKAILSVVSVTDPEIVILSGDLSYLGHDFIQRLTDSCSIYLPMNPTFEFAIKCDRVGLVGAIELALESYSIFGENSNYY